MPVNQLLKVSVVCQTTITNNPFLPITTMLFTKTASACPVIFCLGLGFLSCKTNDQPDTQGTQTVMISELVPGPVIQDTLNADQISKITHIQQTFAEVNPSSLEETIISFRRDSHPDNEISIWLAMADAYEKFTSRHRSMNIHQKRETYRLILMRSMEEEEVAKQKAQPELLTAAEVAEILSYYNLAAEPITTYQK